MFVSSILNISWLDFITLWLVDFDYLTWTPLPGVSIPDRCPLWSCSAIHPACQFDVRTQAVESGPPEVHHSQGRSQSPEGAGKHLYLYLPRGTQGLLTHSQQGSPHCVSLCDAGAVCCSHIGDHTWGCCVCYRPTREWLFMWTMSRARTAAAAEAWMCLLLKCQQGRRW